MDDGLEALFTNEEYEETVFKFGEICLTLKLSNAASTARLLSEYLAQHLSIFSSRAAAVEIGSGLGLAGLVTAQFCDTILTDHNKVVLHVLQQNASANTAQHSIRCELMDWEIAQQVDDIRRLSHHGQKACGGLQGFDLVLGADICYGLRAIPYIFRAYARLLSGSEHALGLLGYVSRAAAVDRGIFSSATAAGLDLQEIPETRQKVEGGLEGVVYELQKQKSHKLLIAVSAVAPHC